MMAIVLGIDSGGTKTEAAVGNSTKVLGRGTAASSKVILVGKETAEGQLHQAVADAIRAAAVEAKDIQYVCVGASGTTDLAVPRFLTDALAELVPAPCLILGDNIIAHEAAFGDGPGVLVIAGTGSIAHGKNEAGERARVGGWGPAISDEGSGFWIGKNAVSEVMRAYDFGHSLPLLKQVSRAWKANSPEHLVSIANASAPWKFSELVPVVLQAANSGDELAIAILNRAGTELARMAEATIRRLWRNPAHVGVAVAGGIFEHAKLIRDVFQASLKKAVPRAGVNLVPVDPVVGALAIAEKYARGR